MSDSDDAFNKLKAEFLRYDPVAFVEKYLTLDGKPFRIRNNGYKPFSDIYRYIGVKALEPGAKPVIMVKGRQVGGTTMAGALEMYFMGSGLFGTATKPPIRVIHTFPQLELAAAYSKTKLNAMISSSIASGAPVGKGGKTKSFMQNLLDTSSATNDSLHFKQFQGGNHIWIESTGLDADRIMGRMLSLETDIPTPTGFIKLKDLKEGDDLFDENGNICQVTKLHPIDLTPDSYKVTFDDGATIDACADHLWLTHTTNELINKSSGTVRNTKEIFESNEKHFIINKLKFINADARGIIKIEKIDSKPMRCLTVNSKSHLFLVTSSFIPTHNTADVLIFDEVQKTSGHAIGNALKILTTAKYGKPTKGVQVFFGTPRRKGSDYHKMWQASSQQYYHLGCEGCKELFPLYTAGSDDWEKIWIHTVIVKCPKCGFEQNKLEAAERGKWVASRDPDDPDCLMVGFHINQLYMPGFTKEDLMGEKPGVHPINTERTYQNEVLGEFFQGDSSPMTPEEIAENCADIGRKFSARIEHSDNDLIFLGIDYGARADAEQLAKPESNKGGQSYSTAVVLKAKGAGILSIEFATKFKRNDPESKKGIIDQIMRQYNVKLAVGDIGYSNDFSVTLANIYGDKYLVSRASGKLNNHTKFNQDLMPKEILFERDYYIAELYEKMKKGLIRFPFGDYDKIGWLIEHCTSMEIKPSISQNLDPVLHYVKSGSPNDGFMALLNAYIGYKFILTKGFSSMNPMFQDENINEAKAPMIFAEFVKRKF